VKNIGLSVQHAIMEAAVLQDQRIANVKKANFSAIGVNHDDKPGERSTAMSTTERDSTDVLNDLLGIPGIDAVVVIGRDGFVIESAKQRSCKHRRTWRFTCSCYQWNRRNGQ
jgi:hypothetical protein